MGCSCVGTFNPYFMIMKIKPKKCKVCGNEFVPRFKTTERYCSYKCATMDVKEKPKAKRTPIKKVSKKRQAEQRTYKQDRIDFLNDPKNKICFIDGCTKPSTTIEHRMGRVGYADDWARENNVPLFLDKRYWAGCCHEHNLELERNPELSRKYQLSKIHGGKKQKK